MKGNVKMVEVKYKQKSFKMRRQFKEVRGQWSAYIIGTVFEVFREWDNRH